MRGDVIPRTDSHFAVSFRRLSPASDDRSLDAFVSRFFRLDPQLAPDIIRGAIRRAIARHDNPGQLWDALSAFAQDVNELEPADRIPLRTRVWAMREPAVMAAL